MVKELGSGLEIGDYDGKRGVQGFDVDIAPRTVLDVGEDRGMPLEALQILPDTITDTIEPVRPVENIDLADMMSAIRAELPDEAEHKEIQLPPMSELMIREEGSRGESPTMRPITLPEYQELVARTEEGIEVPIQPIHLPEQFIPEAQESVAQEIPRRQRLRQMADIAAQGQPPMRPIRLPRQQRPAENVAVQTTSQIPIQAQPTEDSAPIEIRPADYIPPQTRQEQPIQDASPALKQEQIQQFLQALQQMQAQENGGRPGIPGAPRRPRGRELPLYGDDFSLPPPVDTQAPDLPGTGQLPAADDMQIDVGRAIDTYKAESSVEGHKKRDVLGQQLSDLMKKTVKEFLIEKHGEDDEFEGIPKSYDLGGKAQAEELTRRVLRTFISEKYGFSPEIVSVCQEDEAMLYQVFDTLMEKRGYSQAFLHYVGTTATGSAASRQFDGAAHTLGQKVAGIKLKSAKDALVSDESSVPQIEEIINRALREHGKELKPDVNPEDRVGILGTVFAEDGKLYPGQVHEYGYAVKDIERR